MADRPSASDDDGELVGIKSDDSIDVVAGKVSVALGLTLALHDSSYWGDPYFSGWPASDVKLTANRDPMFHDGDPAEERWFSFDGRAASTSCGTCHWQSHCSPRYGTSDSTLDLSAGPERPGSCFRSGVIREHSRRRGTQPQTVCEGRWMSPASVGSNPQASK